MQSTAEGGDTTALALRPPSMPLTVERWNGRTVIQIARRKAVRFVNANKQFRLIEAINKHFRVYNLID